MKPFTPIHAKYTVAIASHIYPAMRRTMPRYTFAECLHYVKNEREYYNANHGYGAIGDHFLFALPALGLG